MARQSTGRGTQPEPEAELDESVRSASADELWAAVRIDPVEIALPSGVGYTLRAYRPVDEVTPTDISEREEDLFPQRRPEPVEEDESAGFDEEFEDEGFDQDGPTLDDDEADETDEDEDDEDDESDEDEEEDESDESGEPEEVPVFLGRAGPELVKRISAEDVVPLPEDTYELDLVVNNLRGGYDAWDASLVIQAGEVARDIGYALRIDPVVGALSTGSPLDDLDEALRATESGGLGGFFARRKLKKIGAEAAPLGWRTIIGKISSVVDWRD